MARTQSTAGRGCFWSQAGPDLSARMWSRPSTRPGGPTSSSTTCSAPTASGATSPSARSPTWSRRPTCSRWLDGRKLDAVIHMGAISDTTATDADLVMENNFRRSMRLLDWCTDARVPFIYASSAATYGDGAEGFNDDWSPASAAEAQADESLRLEQAAVRPGRGRALREEGEAAAAMGRAEVLQRVRPERVPQGRDDEPRRQALRRRQGRPHRAAVQVASRRASATASSGATSSMSTMRSRWCAG